MRESFRLSSRSQRSSRAQHAPRRLGAGLLALACAALALGCFRSGEGDGKIRLLLVAVDGLEWSVVLPLVRDGRMPELERLMREGVFGKLETLVPASSPVIWTSIATGKKPEKHGIVKWGTTDEKSTDGFRLFDSTDRKTKTFWNVLSDFGRRVHVVGWFVTHPVETVNGVMVAQANDSRPADWKAGTAIAKGGLLANVARQVHPPEREGDVMQIRATSEARLPKLMEQVFGGFERPISEQAKSLLDACRWAFRADAVYGAVAGEISGETPRYDVLAVYFGGPDVVGHRFWRYMQPELYEHPPSEDDVASLKRVIPDYYVYVDKMVGRLRKQGGDDLTVMVVSDHGMGPIHTKAPFRPEERGREILSAHHQDGPPALIAAAGPGIRKSQEPKLPSAAATVPVVGHVFDVTPTMLALTGMPIGEDMDGKVLMELLDPDVFRTTPITFVATHDSPEWLAERAGRASGGADSPERMEQLRSLGYVE